MMPQPEKVRQIWHQRSMCSSGTVGIIHHYPHSNIRHLELWRKICIHLVIINTFSRVVLDFCIILCTEILASLSVSWYMYNSKISFLFVTYNYLRIIHMLWGWNLINYRHHCSQGFKFSIWIQLSYLYFM